MSKGDALMQEGGSAEWFYIVKEGEFEIQKRRFSSEMSKNIHFHSQNQMKTIDSIMKPQSLVLKKVSAGCLVGEYN